jgi:hypothetical protein
LGGNGKFDLPKKPEKAIKRFVSHLADDDDDDDYDGNAIEFGCFVCESI